MTRTTVWVAGALCIPMVNLMAQTNDLIVQTNYPMAQTTEVREKLIFRANEASVDFFGSVSVGQKTLHNISADKVDEDAQGGAGVGFNYFFTRYIGLGVDAYSQNTTGVFVDNASANVILRFPIDSIHLAPYVYGGGGYQFDPGQISFGQAGVGLDFRFTSHFGLFTDARYVFPNAGENFGMVRAGLRFAF